MDRADLVSNGVEEAIFTILIQPGELTVGVELKKVESTVSAPEKVQPPKAESRFCHERANAGLLVL
jgi:hypothetical protein